MPALGSGGRIVLLARRSLRRRRRRHVWWLLAAYRFESTTSSAGFLADLAAATAEALAAVLDDPAYAEGARSLAAAVAELPSPATCASLLESLATHARPHDVA